MHYDNPRTFVAGVWINPAVRDGYSVEAYFAVTQQEWPTQYEFDGGTGAAVGCDGGAVIRCRGLKSLGGLGVGAGGIAMCRNQDWLVFRI